MSGGIEATTWRSLGGYVYCYSCTTKGMVEMDGADYRSTFDKKNLYYSAEQFAKRPDSPKKRNAECIVQLS